MKKLITRGLIFGAGFSLGRALYNERTRELNKELIVNGISKLFWGEDAKTYFTRKPYRRPYFSYSTYYAKHCSHEREHRGNIKNHEYKTEYDAAKVLEQMKGFIHDFGFASICDLENCIEKIDGEEIKFVRGSNDRDWGWDDLLSASVHRFSGNRFVIKWPFEKNLADVDDEEDSD